MYILMMTPRSPFARRVRLALVRLGLAWQPEIVDPFKPTAEFLKMNPLGLVPVLVTPDHEPLVDSAAILDVLDGVSSGKIWPRDSLLSQPVRQASVLCTGIMTAAVGFFLESQKPSPDPSWLDDYIDVIERTLSRLEALSSKSELWATGAQLTQASWDLGVALEYISLRCPQVQWTRGGGFFAERLEACRFNHEFSESSPPPPA